MDPGNVMIGWTTTETQDDALRLARGLVEGRLVACAQVTGPITSVFRWEGSVNESQEFRLTVKFGADRVVQVEQWLAKHHTYALPQWICCRADAGSEKYLKWVVDDSS
jgi:periplasmic divalent cation tolerance protein